MTPKEKTFRAVNDQLTNAFVDFQKSKTDELVQSFSANIQALNDENLTMLAGASFIQSTRAWLNKLQETHSKPSPPLRP